MKKFYNRLLKKESKSKGKIKGFSLAETAIALSLIAIVFMMAVTTLLAIASNYKKISNTSFFTNEITNYLDCYKKGGYKDFKENVNKFMFEDEVVSGVGGNGKYVFCYDSNYKLIDGYFALSGEAFENGYKNGAKYFLFVDVNKSFFAYVVDDENEKVATMKNAFYSRYDL